jgi:HEAT repeat protein
MSRVVGCSFCVLLLLAGCSKSTAHWIEQAKADDSAKRLQAIHALQERATEGSTVVPVLLDALKDENTYVRRDAARALGQFGPEAKEAIPALVARLKDREPSVKKAAALSLKQIDPVASSKAGIK